MKIHIGVDESTGCIHSIKTTTAKDHDITAADTLLHGEEKRLWARAGYIGIEKRDEHKDQDIDWFIAKRLGKLRVLPKGHPERQTEKIKAQVRAKVEHPFLWIKRCLVTAKCGIED